jgi:hypothetical protein
MARADTTPRKLIFRMNLGINDIVPEALHRKVGWDIRHHFMAENRTP